MSAAATGRSRWQARLLVLAWLLLAFWAGGILVATWRFGNWREELSLTLVQLNADTLFRARAHQREAVDPEWYRRKALALLAASQRLQDGDAWSVFVPGSWHRFDPLEAQVRARLDQEFGDIVVETVRRELHAQASRLTGVPLLRGTGELRAGSDCQSPVPQSSDRRLTGAAEDMPEFAAVADYVRSVERLDRAVQSFYALQNNTGRPEQLRALVAYTLNKELPGPLAGAVRMFQGNDEVNVQPMLMQSHLQWATRCALTKAMTALHTRLLNTNDLFALEQGLVERSAGLFAPTAKPVAFDRTLERYRAVRALLDDEEALLAKGRNAWMREGSLQLGPAYQDLLARIGRMRLLGPEVAQELQNQSGAAFAEFRRQFQAAFGSQAEPGVVWLENERRFGLSADRAALREGLAALLKTSFMAEEPARTGKPARDSASLARVVQEAEALADERTRALEEIVPVFPTPAQPVVARVIDTRVSELVYQRAYRTLKTSLAADAQAPLDPEAFRQQRRQVLALQALLKENGARALGDRLVAVLDGELLRRLALLQEEWEQLPLNAADAIELAAWQGDRMAIAPSLGASEAAGSAPSLAPAAARLQRLVRRAHALIELGSPGLAADPGAARWLELQAELERYQAHAPDSSLRGLERYLAALGPDLNRDNCAERLAAQAPGAAHEDAIAQRQLALHGALVHRCTQLRALVLTPAASLSQ